MHVRPGRIPSPLSINLVDAGVANLGAVPATADHRQADYFLRLLAERVRDIALRIDKHRKAIAAAAADGDLERCHVLRRMARSEEQDRRALDELIDKLQRRFPPRAAEVVPAVSRKAPAAVR